MERKDRLLSAALIKFADEDGDRVRVGIGAEADTVGLKCRSTSYNQRRREGSLTFAHLLPNLPSSLSLSSPAILLAS